MTACSTCPLDEGPYTVVGSLLLCRRCSTVLVDKLFSSVACHAAGNVTVAASPASQSEQAAVTINSPTMASEILGGVAGACSGIKCGENRTRTEIATSGDGVERHATNSNSGAALGSESTVSGQCAPPEAVGRDVEATVERRPTALNSVIAKDGRDAPALVGVSSLTSAASSGVADFSDCEPFTAAEKNMIASRTLAASEVASAETSSSIVRA